MARPRNPAYAHAAVLKSKGDRLATAGRWREAGKFYKHAVENNGRDVEAWIKLAVTERHLGVFKQAEIYLRRAIALQPCLAVAHVELGVTLQSQGRSDEALTFYDRAVALQPRHPDVHYLKGTALQERSLLDEAAASYRTAVILRPEHADGHAGLGSVLVACGRYGEAEDALRRSLVLKPDAPTALGNLAIVCERHGSIEEAITLYRRALQIAPAAVSVLASFAALLERIGRLEEARKLIDGMEGESDDPDLRIVQARLARRAGRIAQALAYLEKVKEPADLSRAGELNIMRGQLHDQLGNVAEALPALVLGNYQIARTAGVDLNGPPPYLASIALARRHLTPDLANAAPLPDAPDAPVFLVGFPRSGTTLLDQILDTHPQLQTLEEKPAISAMREAFLSMGEGMPLAALTQAQQTQLRRVYFEVVDSYLQRTPNTKLIDKLPLNILWGHLIWRVFPNAKFILALRHPCDVTLSCFMQNFGLNDAMKSFFTLSHTVQTYTATMAFWQEQRSMLPLQTHAVRYENLAADLSGEIQPLLNFLGMPWIADMAQFADHARRRNHIATPSYHQVTQPLYRSALHRWERYGEALAPYLDALRPFIRAFGYDAGHR
jgi:tetratricopeptide (TPR) repeat protein